MQPSSRGLSQASHRTQQRLSALITVKHGAGCVIAFIKYYHYRKMTQTLENKNHKIFDQLQRDAMFRLFTVIYNSLTGRVIE